MCLSSSKPQSLVEGVACLSFSRTPKTKMSPHPVHVLQFQAWYSLHHSMFSFQCHHEWWTINKLAVNEVNLPKGIKAESRVLCSLTLYCRVLEQKNKQKSSHASIPVRGSLKLCVSSALNYWLCKSDRMNKSEAKCFWPTLLASAAIMSTLSNKLTTAQRAFNIWTASPPLCHMNCLFL